MHDYGNRRYSSDFLLPVDDVLRERACIKLLRNILESFQQTAPSLNFFDAEAVLTLSKSLIILL